MTVNIEGSAQSIPESLDSLRTTPLIMHRIWVELENEQQWYAIMADARGMFGKDWKAQSHTRRKFHRSFPGQHTTVRTWFEVPDPTFATWIAVKHAVTASNLVNK